MGPWAHGDLEPGPRGPEQSKKGLGSFYHLGYLVTISQWLIPASLPTGKIPCKL